MVFSTVVDGPTMKEACSICQRAFNLFRHRHVCRVCQGYVCKQCLSKRPSSSSSFSGKFAKCCLECSSRRSAPSFDKNELLFYKDPQASIQERKRVAMLRTTLDALTIRPDSFQQGLEALCHFGAETMQVEMAALTFVDADVHVFQAAVGLPHLPCLPRSDAFCNYVIASKAPMICLNLTTSPHFLTNPFVTTQGVCFYAGAPIIINGYAIGSFCLMDTKPRSKWSDLEHDLLTILSRVIATKLVTPCSTDDYITMSFGTPQDKLLQALRLSDNDAPSSIRQTTRSLSQIRSSVPTLYSPHMRPSGQSLSSSPNFMLDPRDWVPNHVRSGCRVCQRKFSFALRRKHHCRICGEVICSSCSSLKPFLMPLQQQILHIRICSECIAPHQPSGPVDHTFSPNIRLAHASPSITHEDYPSWLKNEVVRVSSKVENTTAELEKLSTAFRDLTYSSKTYLTPVNDTMATWMNCREEAIQRSLETRLTELFWPC